MHTLKIFTAHGDGNGGGRYPDFLDVRLRVRDPREHQVAGDVPVERRRVIVQEQRCDGSPFVWKEWQSCSSERSAGRGRFRSVLRSDDRVLGVWCREASPVAARRATRRTNPQAVRAGFGQGELHAVNRAPPAGEPVGHDGAINDGLDKGNMAIVIRRFIEPGAVPANVGNARDHARPFVGSAHHQPNADRPNGA